MAIISDFNTLVQAVIDLSEDDSVEFASYIPTAIDLAEQRLNRELDLPDLETKTQGTLLPSSNSLPKPSGYRFCNYLNIYVNGRKTQLRKRREDFINDYWPDVGQVDTPKYYSDFSTTAFILAPTPDVSYQYELKFTMEPIRLSATNTTNYFTTRCYDMLFSAVMVEMAFFMKAWSEIQTFEQGYEVLKQGWNATMERYRKDDGEAPNNPQVTANTLKHTSKTNA